MSKRKDENPGWVYLFWCVGTTRYKIGYSRNVGERACAIECQSPYPIRVVAAIRGFVTDERDLHQEFRKHRSHREWFNFDEPTVWKVLERFGITYDMAYAEAHLI